MDNYLFMWRPSALTFDIIRLIFGTILSLLLQDPL